MAKEAEIINAPNQLKNKVSVGGPGAVDADVLARAEMVITEMADQYLDWVKVDLEKLQAAYADLAAAGPGAKDEVTRVFEVAHDMKGQGGSFGYDLITIIGNQVCRMIERSDTIGAAEIEAIGVHVNTMKLVITEEMKGDGGDSGKKILLGLEKVYEKVMG